MARTSLVVNRKTRLEALLVGAPDAILYSDHQIGHGPMFRKIACEHGLEGIISKRVDGERFAAIFLRKLHSPTGARGGDMGRGCPLDATRLTARVPDELRGVLMSMRYWLKGTALNGTYLKLPIKWQG